MNHVIDWEEGTLVDREDNRWPRQVKELIKFKEAAPNMNRDQGVVVQSIVSLTTLLICQLVKYMLTTLSNTLLFFVGKM